MRKYLWISVLGYFSMSTLVLANPFGEMLTPYSIECLDKDEIDQAEKAKIEKTGLNIVNAIKSQQATKLWQMSHPELQKQLDFTQFNQGVNQIVLGDIAKASIEDENLIKIQGLEKPAITIFCGSVKPDDPSHLRVQVFTGNTDIAIVQIKVPNQAFNQLLNLQLAKENGKYQLIRMDVRPTSYHEKNAYYYNNLSKKYFNKKKYVEAFIYNQAALVFSDKGGFLQSALNLQLTNDSQKLQANQTLQNALGVWQLDKIPYQIISMGLITTQSDMSIHIKYLARNGLQPDQVEQDTKRMMNNLRQNYPDLSQEFYAVVFEAYATIPVDNTKVYPVYRMPVIY